jgi:hypothetical protein
MKFSLLVIATCLFACNNQETDKKGNDKPMTNTDSEGAACYAYLNNKDSVLLQVYVKDKMVTGELTYNFYEKDKNTGTIQGEMKGDTLLADYSFVSEGVSSVREVVFLKKGNELTEGHGDADQVGNKLVFKNRSTLNFSGLVLQTTPCEK